MAAASDDPVRRSDTGTTMATTSARLTAYCRASERSCVSAPTKVVKRQQHQRTRPFLSFSPTVSAPVEASNAAAATAEPQLNANAKYLSGRINLIFYSRLKHTREGFLRLLQRIEPAAGICTHMRAESLYYARVLYMGRTHQARTRSQGTNVLGRRQRGHGGNEALCVGLAITSPRF
jgi:hypothetical protein